MNRKSLLVIVLLATFLGSMLSLVGYKYFIKEERYESIESKQKVSYANYSDEYDAEVPKGLNFVEAAANVTPAVVHIKTYFQSTASRSQQSPIDDMLKDFFGERYNQPKEAPQGRRQQASGSGVILTQDGYIVTNNHVVEKADKIEVVLNDKRSYTADLVGTDPTTDLALLKISEEDLPYVAYGNSDDVQIGEWVLAVGNPFNLTSTVTAGIVSAKARNINILRDKENYAIESFLQTDAVVNPGNSGGALVNLKGELVGINTAIASPTGSYTGYAFAVPSTLVKKVVEDLHRYGVVQRALLGVTIMDVTSQLAEEKDIEQLKGVYIASVREGSAAREAGIKEGDVIMKINEHAVNSSSELQEIVARYRPGDEVTITYRRNGKAKVTEAVLQNKLGETSVVKKEQLSVSTALGAQMKPAPLSELKKLNLKNGVKVLDVRGGMLAKAGMKNGFIITHVDKKPVNEPQEVAMILDRTTGAVLIEGYYPDGTADYFAVGK